MSGPVNQDPVKLVGNRRGRAKHKEDCVCFACTRRRAKEAVPVGAGDGRSPYNAARIRATKDRPVKTEALDIDAERRKDLVTPDENPNLIMPHVRKQATDKIYANLPAAVMVGRSPRDRVAQWMALKVTNPKLTNAEIARQIGLTPGSLAVVLSRARKEGWLVFEDPLDIIEHEIIPKTLDNINHFLDAKDRTVTIETAKGVVYPHYREAKGIVEDNRTILALKIELPDGQAVQSRGSIIANPKTIELKPESDSVFALPGEPAASQD